MSRSEETREVLWSGLSREDLIDVLVVNIVLEVRGILRV
jgi:hypothetical protein